MTRKLIALQTYAGEILIAINPFKPLTIYGEEHSRLYRNTYASSTPLPPHLYATADRALFDMLRNKTSQVCVISGESGAGTVSPG